MIKWWPVESTDEHGPPAQPVLPLSVHKPTSAFLACAKLLVLDHTKFYYLSLCFENLHLLIFVAQTTIQARLFVFWSEILSLV